MKNPAAFRGVSSCYLSRDEIRPRCGQLHEAYTCFFSSTFSSSPFKADLKLRMPSPRPFATSGIFLPPNSSTAIPRMTRSSMGPIDLIRTPYNIIVGAVDEARQAAAAGESLAHVAYHRTWRIIARGVSSIDAIPGSCGSMYGHKRRPDLPPRYPEDVG